MKGLKDTLAELRRWRERFERRMASATKRGGQAPATASGLDEVASFGSNPGNLRMILHVPQRLPSAPALVVALHGCTQTAALFDHGSGWSTLADTHGFVLLLPEQQRASNPNACFNWFLPSDTQRDAGEALSIRQMVERAIVDHGVDRRRVFVVGLSAGGAMASTMIATYPEVFAGGAVVAGLPYGSAANVQQAFEAMAGGRDHPAATWGDLVRSASSHRGPWPKVSVWHGTSDTIVSPKNMEHSLKQWIDVHGLPAQPAIEHLSDGHVRRVWRDHAGEDVIEAFAIQGMPHGVPLASQGPQRVGNAGPFHFDVGIASGHHIVRFWRIASTPAVVDAAVSTGRLVPVPSPTQGSLSVAARKGASEEDSTFGERERVRRANQRDTTARPFDPSQVIEAALKSAGLLRAGQATESARPLALDPGKIIAKTLRSVGLLKD